METAKEHQIIEGLRVGREEVEIIHLHFPNDTNCFCALLFCVKVMAKVVYGSWVELGLQ